MHNLMDQATLAPIADAISIILEERGFVLIVGENTPEGARLNYITNVHPDSARRMCISTSERIAAGEGRVLSTETGHA